MRYCTHCGTQLTDDCNFCPKCGKRVSEDVKTDNQTTEQSNLKNTMPVNTSANSTLFFFDILSGIAFLVGVILLGIGGYKEYMFRTSYNLKGLTKAGIDLLRKSTAYSDSISFLIAGGICAGVAFVFGGFLIPFLKALHRNDNVNK